MAGGDVMLDRSIYQRTVRQGKGVDYPLGRRVRARSPAGVAARWLAGGSRWSAGPAGAGGVRSLFRDADLAVVNLEGPAMDAFHWHPKGLTFTFDPALLAGSRTRGSTS